MEIIYLLGVVVVTALNYKPHPGTAFGDMVVAILIGLLWPPLVALTLFITIIDVVRRKPL